MASQSSTDGSPSPIEVPSTPQPQDLELPSEKSLQRAASPSMAVSADGATSVVHPSSSMTPPPSSQIPPTRRAVTPRRSTTPDISILSSPPPTIANGHKRESSIASGFVLPTPEQIAAASAEGLRDILKGVLGENRHLELSVREARMSAAHYKLQHNLLTIESEEALKRMEVEHDMTRREVQALLSSGRGSADYDYTTKLKEFCHVLREQEELSSRRLRKAKKVIEERDFALADLRERNDRLRERIRQNREHINGLRSPGGPLYMGTPKTSPTTPQTYRATPRQTPSSVRSVRHQPPGSARPFEALLLADAVLSQENNSAPSTPIISHHQEVRTPSRHQRGVQSLSSLPTTPIGRHNKGNATLLPSAQFSPHTDARVVESIDWNSIAASGNRRRRSRDSTISVEDAEQMAAANARYREESEEIKESQASQSATEMLRIDPRESFEVAASRTPTPSGLEKNALQQAKIYGIVTKSNVEKRKRAEEDAISEYASKKLRAAAGEAIGLGIGLDSVRR